MQAFRKKAALDTTTLVEHAAGHAEPAHTT
jgi:hypothetical protein